MAQATLFDNERMSLSDSIGLTAASLRAYGERYDHWAVAFSGGKDSSTVLTAVIHLLKTGQIPRPKRLSVCYADTRMELPPLSAAATAMLDRVREDGFEVRIALPPIDDRYFVYMLGRGVPPPSNTFRWCTGQLKVEPMEAELEKLASEVGGKILMLTGVRQGESAQRDQRIAVSCGKAGSECGQGWYQESLPEHLCDTLAPILHWRVCLVWDWLAGHMPAEYRHGYPTQLVAEAYGLGEESGESESNARTGCTGCPLATKDSAIENLLRFPRWDYLRPLTELRPIYRWLKLPANRLRKPGGEKRQDGTLARNQNRMGPLTMEARREALAKILDIQAYCNELRPDGVPPVDMLNAEEVARIHELIEANTWPRRWSGDEPRADEPFLDCLPDGSVQTSFLGN